MGRGQQSKRYEVQFFRGSSRVFVKRVDTPRLTLPSRWRYAGRDQTLEPGVYRWYVWSLRNGAGGLRDDKPVVQAAFTIPRST